MPASPAPRFARYAPYDRAAVLAPLGEPDERLSLPGLEGYRHGAEALLFFEVHVDERLSHLCHDVVRYRAVWCADREFPYLAHRRDDAETVDAELPTYVALAEVLAGISDVDRASIRLAIRQGWSTLAACQDVAAVGSFPAAWRASARRKFKRATLAVVAEAPALSSLAAYDARTTASPKVVAATLGDRARDGVE